MTCFQNDIYALLGSGRAGDAKQRCMKALERNPIDSDATEMLLRALKATADLDTFCAHADKILSMEGPIPRKLLSALGSFARHMLPSPEGVELAGKIYERGRTLYPEVPWYYLIIGDLHLYAGDRARARQEYARGLEEIDPSNFGSDNTSIYRYLLKRLANLHYENGEKIEAAKYFKKFKDLGAYNFFVSDCIRYADCLAELGSHDDGMALLLENLKKMPNKGKLRSAFCDFREKHKDSLKGSYEIPPATRKPREGIPDRVPVKTHIITEKDDMVEVVSSYTKDVAGPGDVIAVAESVAAIAEGRAVSVETIEASAIAAFLSKFVSDKTAPLGSPQGMQVAIDEVGLWKIFLGLFGGVCDKLTHGKGGFYRIAGAQTALIDDMSGGMPPYDHHVIKGPRDPDGLARLIRAKTGVDACVVDANDMQVAWVVGASDGVDRKYLETVLSDNPAGNEDQQTPIVVVKLSSFKKDAASR